MAVLFIPQDPKDEANENHLFYIYRRTAENTTELDGETWFTVGGVDYIWSTPTDVQYVGPEEDVFCAMKRDLPGIMTSVQTIE